MRLIPTTKQSRFALGGLLVAALLGLGIAGAAVASAHGERDGDRPTTEERLDRVEDKLADGTIDEERATELRERIAAHEERHAARDAAHQELADLLGMTTDEMHEARHDGTTLAEMAEAAGVDIAQVIDLLTSQAEARIDAALADAKIDQERADEIRESLAERIQAKVDGEHLDGETGKGHRRGRGHGHSPTD